MADQRFASPQGSDVTTGTGGCPRVADLINYGLGHASYDERQRIEMHLQEADCSHCRGWVEKAARVGPEPGPNRTAHPSLMSFVTLPPAFAPPLDAQTPIPESSKWQSQAFRELERRLKLLAET